MNRILYIIFHPRQTLAYIEHLKSKEWEGTNVNWYMGRLF